MTRIPELQAALVRAAMEQQAGRRRGYRIGRRRYLAVALAALVGVGGSATAARLITTEGAPIEPAPKGDYGPRHGHMVPPTPGTDKIVATVPDPSGGLRWGLRMSRGKGGMVCTGVGQILKGKLGTVGRDGVFHALPLRGPDTCNRPTKRDELGWGVSGVTDRMVVYGTAGSDIVQLRVVAPQFHRVVKPAAQGGYIVVLPGTVSIYDIKTVARFRDGSVQAFGGRQARTPHFEVQPAAGTKTSAFTVRFHSPFAADEKRDAYRVVFTHPGRGCGRGLANGSIAVPAPGSRDVTVKLEPGSGHSWCRGRYKAFVQFVDFAPGVKCAVNDEAAGLCSRERPVGRFFTFRVE